MHCPFCSENDTKVIDSRLVADGHQVRRRRQCLACSERFTTFESAELVMPTVIKSNGNREPFNEDKMVGGVQRALEKRPVSVEQTEKAINRLNSRIPSFQAQIQSLSGGQRQAVAIARAVNWGADIVIMDEPTAALGVEQSAQVNELINVISSQGVAVLLISHNMQHVIDTCDRAVVLYQGQSVADVSVSDVTKEDLVSLITGAKTALDVTTSKVA